MPKEALTLIHKSESTQKNRVIMGSMSAELKRRPYGYVFRLKPLVERFYTQYLWRTSPFFAESFPSHGDGRDFPDWRFVYKYQEPLRNLEWKGSILVMAWSPDGNYIATGDQDTTVHFWITKTGTDLQMYGYPTKVRELSWDSTSRYLATGGGPTVTIWDCSGKGPEGSKPIELKGHATFLSTLAFKHHGRVIASASTNGTLMFWQIDKPKQPLLQASLGSGISQLAWSLDDHLVAVGTEAGVVTVYSAPEVR